MAKDYDENIMHSSDWKKRKREHDHEMNSQKNANNVNRHRKGLLQAGEEAAMVVEQVEQMNNQQQSQRCFSCNELKLVASFIKNEKKKGVEGRCISCVATNPSLDILSHISRLKDAW